MTDSDDSEEITVRGVCAGGVVAERANGEMAVLSRAVEGQPIHNDLVRLTPIEGQRYRMTTLYKHGPAQVTTDEYRNGWDAIFGKKQVKDDELRRPN